MPTYEYACTECGDRTEVVQSIADAPPTTCAVCGGRLRKVFSPVGIVFKVRVLPHRLPRQAGQGRRRQGQEAGRGHPRRRPPRPTAASPTPGPPRPRPPRRAPDRYHARGRRPGGRPRGGLPRWSKGASGMARPQAELGVFGGSGFYAFLDGVEEHKIETPYGAPSDKVAIGEVEGRRVAFLPRHGAPPPVPAPQDPLPGQPLGDEGAGGQPGDRPLRRRFAAGRGRPRPLRDLRPAGGPDLGPRRHLLRRPRDHPHLLRRPLLPRAARSRPQGGRGPGHHRPRRRHHGGHPGPPLLDPGREPLVPEQRLEGHQHDRLPRGPVGPRARALLRERLADHRLRRRPGGHARGPARLPLRGRAGLRREQRQAQRSPLRPLARHPGGALLPCATALEGARFEV